jgi:trehalose utilization protein
MPGDIFVNTLKMEIRFSVCVGMKCEERKMIHVTVWNEFRHEKENEEARKVYPEGIHAAIADMFSEDDRFSVRTATLDEKEEGLPQRLLDETDVLFWWGHKAHDELSDETASRVQKRVLEGMGFVALHSSHLSKPFKLLMGTTCSLRWRESGEKERLWNIAPFHPIAAGLPEYFELPHTEMYGERFDIPEPERVVFSSWFAGGEVFRSGCVWTRGNGRVFYFRPGHETFPIYYDENIRRILINAAEWTAARVKIQFSCPNVPAIEPIE